MRQRFPSAKHWFNFFISVAVIKFLLYFHQARALNCFHDPEIFYSILFVQGSEILENRGKEAFNGYRWLVYATFSLDLPLSPIKSCETHAENHWCDRALYLSIFLSYSLRPALERIRRHKQGGESMLSVLLSERAISRNIWLNSQQ